MTAAVDCVPVPNCEDDCLGFQFRHAVQILQGFPSGPMIMPGGSDGFLGPVPDELESGLHVTASSYRSPPGQLLLEQDHPGKDMTSLSAMSQRPVYTSFSIPTVITHPSVRCLQWSDDGQLCLVTKSAVHILTPDHGINFSTPADVKSPIRNESDRPLGWYRTMIETVRAQTHSWPGISQGWGSLTLGSLDVSIRAVTCSPSGLTSRGRCVIAVLNSNMEVSLWAAGKNHLKGEWSNNQDVTAYLLGIPRLVHDIDETAWILGIQVLHGQASRAGLSVLLR
ncbi:transcription factor IIIC subunit delta N-term-domain-containing protein [Lanmaoa asiatica]|nr:transcription factor IIIC subunit delta N-term-domain-containing protein [Lanmaoa asiatica]